MSQLQAIADALQREEMQLQKMLEKKKLMEQRIRKRLDALNEKKRKIRTRRLIQLGGLLEIAQLTEQNEGLLLGAFLEIAERIGEPERARAWKAQGDALLLQRQAERKGAAQAAATVEEMEAEEDG